VTLRNYDYRECARKTYTGLQLAGCFAASALFALCLGNPAVTALYLLIASLFFRWARVNSRAFHQERKRRSLLNDPLQPVSHDYP
jgi:hypothetical protein